MEALTVRAAQSGDRAALALLVDDFTPTVLGAAYGLCGDWDLAGDIAQEAFATVVARLGDLRDPAAFPGWLMAVVRSVARRQRSLVVPAANEPAIGGPEEVVIARDDARRVRLAVEALSPEMRLPMALHYFAGRPLSDIASLCELPLSTVKKRMRVAREMMRERMDDMAEEVAFRMRPEPSADPTDVIRMYTAMRSGDVARVVAILDTRPDLIDVRENWTRSESFAHRLPWTTGGGTPLLRAVERGDAAMVRLLLDRGADPNGSCTCEGGESPLWVAVTQRETEVVDELLSHGARPDTVAFNGTSALEIAIRRGYDEIVERLLQAGASPAIDHPDWQCDVPADATGIKTIDLWCPFPTRGLVHLTPGFGIGAYVLVAELSYRATRIGRNVVWTGFVSAPTDLGDFHHALAESNLIDVVTLSMADPTTTTAEQVAALDRGVGLADDDTLLVIFEDTGRLHHIDERLSVLSQRAGVTLIVAPLDGSVAPPRPSGSPYLASVEFDLARAKRRQWPAISSSSWSKVADSGIAALAEVGRRQTSGALDDYLVQPFYVAEHVTGQPGQSVSRDVLCRELGALLQGAE